MLCLLSMDIDEDKASIPLMNETKQQLMEMGEDFRVAHVRDFIEKRREAPIDGSEIKLSYLCDEINEACGGLRLSSRSLRPILQHIGLEVWQSHNQYVTRIDTVGYTRGSSNSESPQSPLTEAGTTSDSTSSTIMTVDNGSDADALEPKSVKSGVIDDLWGE